MRTVGISRYVLATSLLWLVSLLVFSAIPARSVADPKRVALIIANADYTRGLADPAPDPCPESDVDHLCNVEDDAHLVESALIASGFQDVILSMNQRRDDIRALLDKFRDSAKGAQVALIYLAGHGLLSKNANWFVPIGSRTPIDIHVESDIPLEAFNLDAFVSATAGADWRIVVMDACRNNPFAQAISHAEALRRQKIAAQYQHANLDNGTLLIYSTPLGQTAQDGPDNQGSDFARAFARRISQSKLPLRRVGQEVAKDMRAASSGDDSQIPAIVDTLPDKPFSLVDTDDGAALAADEDDWQQRYAAYRKTGDTSSLESYLRTHRAGVFAAKARALIAARRSTSVLTAGSSFRDCEKGCPEMVVAPAGTFRMTASDKTPTGAPASQSQDAVTISFAKPFAVGRYPVTFEEWDACVDDHGCPTRLDDDHWGRGRRPVIHASWEDAQAYVQWLSNKTGMPYRLLSDAEYDYMNRADSTSTFWWGEEVGQGHANCKGCGQAATDASRLPIGKQTLPVGSFPPNPFGLFDTEGNVVSWTLNCWNETLARQSHDGRANQSGDCTQRVLRGGSWRATPNLLESSYRGSYNAKQSRDITGFRVARALP